MGGTLCRPPIRRSKTGKSNCGAGRGNRTPGSTLEGSRITTIQHPQLGHFYRFSALYIKYLLSGRRESDSVYLLPKQAYYRYTTPRRRPSVADFDGQCQLKFAKEGVPRFSFHDVSLNNTSPKGYFPDVQLSDYYL